MWDAGFLTARPNIQLHFSYFHFFLDLLSFTQTFPNLYPILFQYAPGPIHTCTVKYCQPFMNQPTTVAFPGKQYLYFNPFDATSGFLNSLNFFYFISYFYILSLISNNFSLWLKYENAHHIGIAWIVDFVATLLSHVLVLVRRQWKLHITIQCLLNPSKKKEWNKLVFLKIS